MQSAASWWLRTEQRDAESPFLILPCCECVSQRYIVVYWLYIERRGLLLYSQKCQSKRRLLWHFWNRKECTAYYDISGGFVLCHNEWFSDSFRNQYTEVFFFEVFFGSIRTGLRRIAKEKYPNRGERPTLHFVLHFMYIPTEYWSSWLTLVVLGDYLF